MAGSVRSERYFAAATTPTSRLEDPRDHLAECEDRHGDTTHEDEPQQDTVGAWRIPAHAEFPPDVERENAHSNTHAPNSRPMITVMMTQSSSVADGRSRCHRHTREVGHGRQSRREAASSPPSRRTCPAACQDQP